MKAHRRRFLRHAGPSPIAFRPWTAGSNPRGAASGLGLSFPTTRMLVPGSLFELTIPVPHDPQNFVTHVTACKKRKGGYLAKVSFVNQEDVFRARMAEQVCHIAAYRDRVQRSEGRNLTEEAAAEEWIYKFASSFPAD